MDFFTGFLCAWFLLGCFALIGLDRDWYLTKAGFWAVLSFPAMPVAWLVIRFRDLFR